MTFQFLYLKIVPAIILVYQKHIYTFWMKMCTREIFRWIGINLLLQIVGNHRVMENRVEEEEMHGMYGEGCITIT